MDGKFKFMQKALLILPIYLRSREQYYKCDEKKMQEAKKKYEELFPGKSFNEDNFKERPPYEFNDIIGYFLISEINGFINVVRLHEVNRKTLKRPRRICKSPFERERGILVGDPEGTSLDFEKRIDLLPISIKKNSNLKKEIVDLIKELERITREDGFHLDIAYYLKILDCLDIKKFLSL